MISIILTLTAADNDGAGPCTAVADAMVLTLNPGTCCNGAP